MKLEHALASLLLGGAVLGGPSGAAAYCRTTTTDATVSDCSECIKTGLPLYWAVSSPEYIFNVECFDDVDDTVLHAAIQRSFLRWNDIECDDGNGRKLPIGLNIQVKP